MKQMIVCIVGPSGSGKTTLASIASKELNIPTLCSYTTRPKRENEINGVDHFFVSKEEMPTKDKMLAYTKFGDYEYWASIEQIPEDKPILYVIDEKGLMMLIEEWGDQYEIASLLIKRDKKLLIETVGEERVKRDHSRVKIDENSYDAVISNNGSLTEFLKDGVATIKLLID